MGSNDAQRLAERHLADARPQRWQHVQAVVAEADRLCAELDAAGREGFNREGFDREGFDREVILSAAWLHDIGYATDLLDSGFHPLDGARYLRRHGWDRQVCGLVAHHSDAALQAERLGLAQQLKSEFTDVRGIARDVVWAADVTIGPSGQPMTVSQRIAEIADRYGSESLVAVCMIASRPSLEAAVARATARFA